jgi:hypothetical protein
LPDAGTSWIVTVLQEGVECQQNRCKSSPEDDELRRRICPFQSDGLSSGDIEASWRQDYCVGTLGNDQLKEAHQEEEK